jgi:Mrp family chromosome partitioning ATPase
MGVDNISGLSNLLTDETLDWRSVITGVAKHPGWDLLTAGREPPDPPRLLSSKRMGQLMEELSKNGNYDLIIVDTPPALGLADSALIAEQVDGLLMVVSLRRVPRDMPAMAIRRIREAGAPVLGIITNARQLRRGVNEALDYNFKNYPYETYTTSGKGRSSYVNDPLMAYSYYNNPGRIKDETNKVKGVQPFAPTPRNIKSYILSVKNKLNNWLNE